MTEKTALISDFDGTISDDDFFTYITKAYFDDKALEPWHDYLAHRKTHFNALNEMFQKLRGISEADLQKMMDKIQIDKNFEKTAQLCAEKNIPLYICSAGCDYYINYLIGDIIKKYNITLITNHGVFSQENGLTMYAPDKDSPYYDKELGISKASIVNKLHAEGYKVIFAGDGPPDFDPAKIAEDVFAKKMLLERCRETGIKTHEFNSFNDIYAFIKEK